MSYDEIRNQLAEGLKQLKALTPALDALDAGPFDYRLAVYRSQVQGTAQGFRNAVAELAGELERRARVEELKTTQEERGDAA